MSKHIFLGNDRIVTKQVALGTGEDYDNADTGVERKYTYYYHADHLGSTSVVTDWDGEVYERLEYTPYGETWLDETNGDTYFDTPYRFTAKEKDEETGLYYYGARYLDPKYSRWISADPALGEYLPQAPVNDEAKKHNQSLPGMGGVFNVINLNLYHYAGNNPIKYTDPDGKIQFQVQAKYTMQNPSWGSRNLKGTAERSNTLARSGCAVTLVANLFNTLGVGDMNPAKVNKSFVTNGSVNWDAVGESLGMNVEAVKGKELTVDTLSKQHGDSSKGYLTFVNVNYDSGKHDHWVGVTGATTIDGKDYLSISNTSDNDSAVGKDDLRGKQGWIERNGKILVPVSETKGYINFTAPVVSE